ncbi:MAG: lipopolysaccharide biosynthesis protein [Planctomycetes bacterium]|nr:lipopolysaccharide biosynthesis protein [Planctomycetota bacterium]
MTDLPEHHQADLGRQAARGSAVVFAMTFVAKLVALGVVAILARLLAPEDYGLIGMITPVIGFLNIFSDLGLRMATVQKHDLTDAQVSSLFWINLAGSSATTAVVALCAPLIASFYSEPRLVPVAVLASLTFVLSGLGIQHSALLMRRLLFGRATFCELASILLGGAVGIFMALRGFGVFALAGQLLGQAAGRTLSAWILSGWIPGPPRRNAGIRKMLSFGGYLTGFNILNYLSQTADKVILGFVWGAVPLGLYSKAYTLMLWPLLWLTNPLGTVMMPALAKLSRDGDRLAAAYGRGLRFVCVTVLPLMALMMVLADEVVLMLYGGAWTEAAPVFRALCVGGVWLALANSAYHLMVASGNSRRLFRGMACLLMLLLLAFSFGIRYGQLGLAYANSIAMSLGVPLYLWYLYASAGFPVRRVFSAAAGPAIAALVAGSAAWTLKSFALSDFSAMVILAACAAVHGMVYLLILRTFFRGTLSETLGWALARLLRRGTGDGASFPSTPAQ